jgi:hypothetical protein
MAYSDSSAAEEAENLEFSEAVFKSSSPGVGAFPGSLASSCLSFGADGPLRCPLPVGALSFLSAAMGLARKCLV